MSLHTHLCAVPLLDGNIPEQIHGQRLGATGIRQGNRWHIGHHACGLDSNSRSKVCVKYAGPMELWNDALVTPCEGQSRRGLSHLRLSANTAMLRTACFLCVIGHRELLPLSQAPCSNGRIWLIDSSMGLGTGKIVAVLAVDAHHHQRVPNAVSLDRVHCLGVSVAD